MVRDSMFASRKVASIKRVPLGFDVTLDDGAILSWALGENGYRWYVNGSAFISRPDMEIILGLPSGSIEGLVSIFYEMLRAEDRIVREAKDKAEKMSQEYMEAHWRFEETLLGQRHARLKRWRERSVTMDTIPEVLQDVRHVKHFVHEIDSPARVYFLMKDRKGCLRRSNYGCLAKQNRDAR